MEIVKGNDIRVVWAITKLVDNVNVPEDLSTASNIRFKVICSGTYIQVPDYSISGNEITFTIKGSAQRTGLYSFEVSYSKGYDARVVYKDAFTVVDLACQANYVKPDDIQVTTLEFYSCISSLYLWQLLDVEKSTTDNSVKNSLDDFYLGYDAKSKTWYGKQIPPETFKLEDMWRELDATNEIIPKHHLDLSGLTTEHYVDQVRQYLQEQIDDLSSRGGAVDEAQVTEIILRLLGRWFKEDENQDIYVVQKSVPKLDEEGNPVMDANGKPMYVEVGRGLYTTGFLSAKGKQTGSGGGGTGGGLIQTVYGSKDLGGTFKDDDLNNTFNAYTINAINTKTDNAVTLATEAKTLATTAKTAADNATTLANKAIADAKTANDKAQQAIDIASKFNRFFTAINASGGEIAADDTTTAIESIRANYSLWTNGYLSAKGQQQGSGGGTGGLVTVMYRWDDLGGTFDNNANDTFNAYTINRIYQLANIKLTTTGSGNAVTNITLGSGNLTVTKGESFATKAEFNTLNTKVTNFLEGTDTDDIINKWKELEAFLSGMKESDNLAAILATKADKSYVDSTFVTLATAQTITGAKAFTADLKTSNILPITNTTSSLGSDILRWLSGYYNSFIQIGDVRLEYDAAKTALKIIHKDGTTNVGLYSTGWLSAKGAQVGGSSGGGLISTIYRFADLGGTFDDSNNDTFTAYTINEIWKIAQDSGIKNITITGSGNAITDLVPSSDGKTLTASKGVTFATAASVTTLSDSKADKTITLTAGTGLTGGGDLSANRTFALATSGATAGTYTKVTVDAYGRVTKGAALAEGDIPNLSWSKITGKPTTIAGYGITDAYTKAQTDAKYVTLATAQEISGGKTFLTDLRTSHILPSATGTKNLGGSTLRWLNTFTATLDATNVVVADSIRIGNGLIKWDSVNNAVYFVHTQADTTVGVYSTGWMSTMGVQVGGGSVSSLADLTDVTLTSPTNNQVLTYDSATSKWINKTIQTGLDLTAMWNELKKADTTKVIDVSHIPNLPWSKITSGKPTTLAGYGITDAYTKAQADGRYVTIATAQNVTAKKTFTVQQAFNVAQGTSPFTVVSNTVVTNLRANYANVLDSHGNLTAVTGTIHPTSGVTLNGVYNNGYPVAYGNLLRLNSNGGGSELLLSWFQNNRIFYRSIRDNTDSWLGWVELLHTGNYDSTLGSVYVKKTGDTMTGLLTLKTGSLHTGIKCGNSYMSAIDGSVIFQNNAGGIRFSTIDNWDWNVWAGLKYVHSSKTVYLGLADGTIFTTNTAQTGGTVSMVNCKVQADYYLARNTTLCTNLNADMIDSVHLAGFGGNNGVIRSWSRGQYITVNQYFGNGNVVTFDPAPTDAGGQLSANTTVLSLGDTRDRNTQLAFLYNSDTIRYRRCVDGPTWTSWVTLLHTGNYTGTLDGRYVKKAGDRMSGSLATEGSLEIHLYQNDSVNPMLLFHNQDRVWANITYRRDSIFHFVYSNSSIGTDYSPLKASSFIKSGSSDSYVLLGGGGHKALSTMQSEYDARYVNVTGDTMSGGLTLSSGYVTLVDGWFQNNSSGGGLYNSNQDARWYASNGWWKADKPIQGHYFKSVIDTGIAPYQCSSTTLNTNLNADLLDGYHASAFRMGYNGSGAKYRLAPWGGSTDTSWRWIVRYVNTGGGTYQACTVIGTIWFTSGNHSQAQVVDIPFQAMFYAYGGTANSMLNQSYLYLPQYCQWDLIRIVRYANNSWELQIRQPYDWSLISTEYTVRVGGGSATAGQFSSSGIHSSTIANSYNLNKSILSNQYVNRADHADRLTTARNFYINSHDNYRAGAATSFNGTGDVTLKLPNSIRCNNWFRSTENTGWYNETHQGGIYMTDSSYVRVYNNKHFRVNGLISCGEHQDDAYGYYNCTRGNSTSTAYSCYAMVMNGTRTFGLGYRNTDIVLGSCTTSRTINPWVYIDGGRLQMQGNIYATGAMTAKSSGSDIRLKKNIQSYNAMSIINRFRSVKYHWNAIAKANSEVYNNDYDQYGLIAQDLLAGGYKQWVKDVFKDYYTIEYERLIPVVWKGLQEVDSEVDKLKKEVATLKNRIAILEGRKSLSA